MDMNNLWYYHHLSSCGLVHTTCVLLGYSKNEKPNAVSLLFTCIATSYPKSSLSTAALEIAKSRLHTIKGCKHNDSLEDSFVSALHYSSF